MLNVQVIEFDSGDPFQSAINYKTNKNRIRLSGCNCGRKKHLIRQIFAI